MKRIFFIWLIAIGFTSLIIFSFYLYFQIKDFNETKNDVAYEVFIKDNASLKDVIDVINGYHSLNVLSTDNIAFIKQLANNSSYELRPLKMRKLWNGNHIVYKYKRVKNDPSPMRNSGINKEKH